MPCWGWGLVGLVVGMFGIPVGMVLVAWMMGPPVSIHFGTDPSDRP